jgi:hypothetical protein
MNLDTLPSLPTGYQDHHCAEQAHEEDSRNVDRHRHAHSPVRRRDHCAGHARADAVSIRG